MSRENSIHLGIAFAEVECTDSISGNREYTSMITNKYSPVERGPQKLMFSVCHSLHVGGNGDM